MSRLKNPISLSIEEGRLLANEAKRLGRVTRNDSEFRGNPHMRLAAQAVLNGRIGKLRKIHTTVPAGDVTAPPVTTTDPIPKSLNYDFWLGPCPEAPYIQRRVHDPEKFDRPHWMRVLGHCEGMVTNWGTHLNDIAQMAMGTNESGPVWVKAARWDLPPKENLWNVLVDFDIDYRYANGTELNYKVGGKEVYVRFEGDEGWIKAWYMGKPEPQGPEHRGFRSKNPRGPRKSPIQLPSWGDKEDFIRCVKSRERTMQDVEYGHRTCSLCQLGHISVKLGGREITWDPAQGTIARSRREPPDQTPRMARPLARRTPARLECLSANGWKHHCSEDCPESELQTPSSFPIVLGCSMADVGTGTFLRRFEVLLTRQAESASPPDAAGPPR